MAGPKPTTDYTPYPTTDPSVDGSGASPIGVRATPQEAGSQVGAAIEKTGNEIEQRGEQAMQSAIETKANSTIVDQWAPTAASLRSDYDRLQGVDKINGYDTYISNLQSAQKQMLDNASGPLERKYLGGYTGRHIENEISGARREADVEYNNYQGEVAGKKVLVDLGFAVDNYNNPEIVSQAMESQGGTIAGYGQDNNWSKDQITHAQNAQQANTAGAMINRAVQVGDVGAASKLYGDNKEVIPGFQRQRYTSLIHTAGMQQFGTNAAGAIINGEPIPPSPVGGADALQVKAAIANVAQQRGRDPNELLTLSSIEDGFGQHLGVRDTIGQTKEGKGASRNDQIGFMDDHWQASKAVADSVVGGKAQPWQSYAVYQQGAGGGPALMNNLNARAIDVLKPFEGKEEGYDAKQAIIKNGGNLSMTAGQFLDHIHQTWDQHAQMSAVTIPPGQNAGDAIMAPHTTNGIAAQPGATPMQKFDNFEKVYSTALERANSLPNDQERSAAVKYLDRKHAIYNAQAEAYKHTALVNVRQTISDPKFTDTSMLAPDQLYEATQIPGAMNAYETGAKHNQRVALGVNYKDKERLGTGVFDIPRMIHQGAIKSPDELFKYLPDSGFPEAGQLTQEGFKEFSSKTYWPDNAEDKNRSELRQLTQDRVRNSVLGLSNISGYKKGMDLALDDKINTALVQVIAAEKPAIADAQKKGYPVESIYDPESPHWIGLAAKALQRSPMQQQMDMYRAQDMERAKSGLPERTPETIYSEYKRETDPAKKEALKKEIITRSGGKIVDDEKSQIAPIPNGAGTD